MPLYMDFHKIAGLTIEDVRKAHLADLAVQEKYGVKYHQFWLNQEAGTIFCLTEGPDMATCEMVHRLAHGNVACAMTEVEPGYYKIFMGENHETDHGIVRNQDGSMDLGYRSILMVNRQLSKVSGAGKSSAAEALEQSRKYIVRKITECEGRQVTWTTDDNIIGVFHDVNQAILCAGLVLDGLAANNPSVTFRAGLSVGQPVTETGEFFTTALTLAQRLCSIAALNQLVISSLAYQLYKEEQQPANALSIRWLNPSEENFISKLFEAAEANLSEDDFSIDILCADMGVSRPQLYRKITTLTRNSPNDFLRELRMNKALILLKRRTGNISEIALEVGFKSPSYFAKCFTRQFGSTPSRFVELISPTHSVTNAR